MTIPALFIYHLALLYRKKEQDWKLEERQCDVRLWPARHLRLPNGRTEMYKKSPRYASMRVYSQIPVCIRELQKAGFKKELKKLLTDLLVCPYEFEDFFKFKFWIIVTLVYCKIADELLYNCVHVNKYYLIL